MIIAIFAPLGSAIDYCLRSSGCLRCHLCSIMRARQASLLVNPCQLRQKKTYSKLSLEQGLPDFSSSAKFCHWFFERRDNGIDNRFSGQLRPRIHVSNLKELGGFFLCHTMHNKTRAESGRGLAIQPTSGTVHQSLFTWWQSGTLASSTAWFSMEQRHEIDIWS